MKALTASTLALAILIGCWGLFYYSSAQSLTQIIDSCEETVMPAIEKEDWKTAEETFSVQYELWHHYRKTALFFLDTQSVNEADGTFAKTLMYIKAEDVSNSSGELLALQEQLRYLYENEKVNLSNIL